ncbi:tetratricopeptide repeat protein [Leptolyngbya sp. AN02str]|uniref:tetratricopeptide repeat protein n=1 Tax=Leptolyngbya sp. AN02str TaxID=3423363 RepID=UPI003D3164CA
MFDKRNRIVLSSILIVAALAFLGLMFMPILGALQAGSRTAQPGSSPAASPTAQQEELEAQAKGYTLVLQREPENQTALKGLLEVRIRQGKIEDAIEPLEKLAQLNPEETEYTVLLAQAKQQVGDREGAARAYRDILSRQPGDMNALQGLVGLLIQQQRPEAAIGLLQDTLRTASEQNQVKPGSVNVTSVQLLLGQVYAEQNRDDEAIAVYDEAIRNDGQDFRPVLAKALVLQSDGREADAQPLFETAAALAPAQYKDQINQLASGQQPTPDAGAAEGAASEDAADPTETIPTPAGAAESSSPSRVTGSP